MTLNIGLSLRAMLNNQILSILLIIRVDISIKELFRTFYKG